MQKFYRSKRYHILAWKYFLTDGTKFKGDKDHLASWCILCHELEVSNLESWEKSAHILDETVVQHSRVEIDAAGIWSYLEKKVRCQNHLSVWLVFAKHPRPTCVAKSEYMLGHLQSCTAATEDIRAWASHQLEMLRQSNVVSEESSELLGQLPMSRQPNCLHSYSIIHSELSTSSTFPPTLKRLKISWSEGDSHFTTSESTSIGLFRTTQSSQPLSSLAFYPRNPQIALFSPDVQQDFENDLCKVFAANGWAWAGADNPWFQWFYRKWIPGSRDISAWSLSGPILERQMGEMRGQLESLQGKLRTGQCDEWRDIAKTNVVGSLISVDGDVS